MKYSLNDCVKRALSIRCVFEISVKFEEFEIQELQKISIRQGRLESYTLEQHVYDEL